ncbi:MAG: toxin-antitoxin system YwqK family antitoxin [Bacteroidales bacterium]|nr:toxin-antitoxin system YwqK family antitoxin [Bacteroidales bacterium]
MKKTIVLLFASLLVASCSRTGSGEKAADENGNILREYYGNGTIKTEIEVQDSLRQGITRNFDRDGNLLSTVTYVNNVKNGTVTNYYVPSGSVSSTFEYVDGIKQGDEVWYYESGKDYRVTPYVDGEINGIQKYYYESGQLMAEVPYKNGFPGKGLKEYNEDGSLITDYPDIVVTKEDYLATANSVLLKFSLSNKATKVQFYRGTLNEGIYLHDELHDMATQAGVTQISFNLPKGARVDQQVYVAAGYETRFGNPCVLSTSYNLQIYNTN